MASISPHLLKVLSNRRYREKALERAVNPEIMKPLKREQYGTTKRLEAEKAEGSPTEARRIEEYKDYTEDEKAWKTGESPEQLDRPKEVWERFDVELDEGIISPLDASAVPAMFKSVVAVPTQEPEAVANVGGAPAPALVNT